MAYDVTRPESADVDAHGSQKVVIVDDSGGVFDASSGVPVLPTVLSYTRTMFQGTSVATGTPAATYSVSLADIDMDTATVVLVSSAGSVTVEAQVSFDGSTNKAPSTPVTLFSAVAAGTHIIGLKNVLVSSSNPIWGPYMTGDIDIASAASTISLYLMAQGK